MTSPLPRPPKYAIGPEPAPLDPALLDVLAQCETTMLGHILHWGAVDPALRPNAGLAPRTAGRALTVQCPGPCSTILHHAIGLAAPGDILMIDRLGDGRYACLGDGVAAAAMRQGIRGAVIDGPCTDSAELASLGFPVWCRGVSPITTRLADIGGRARVPVSVGGVAVAPGDAVLCDGDGVFVLVPDEAMSAVDIALRRAAAAAARRATGPEGRTLGEISGASALVQSDLAGNG